MPLMEALDPARLAERQLELDRARTARYPDLLARKLVRMSASPLAFLRGAAPLFYEILRAHDDLEGGAAGEGWLVGDAHLENFGAYRPDPYGDDGHKSLKKTAVFNLNDFDEAVVAPWRWDVLRLTTSLILGGRELGADGMRVLGLSEKLIESYVAAAFDRAKMPAVPRPVAALVDQVQSRSKKELLDARTQVEKGQRHFVRGVRYKDVAREVEKEVPQAFARYAEKLPEPERPTKEQLEILDCAFRIAGTGSLGALRIAVLTRGKGSVDGGWVFDMKEQGTPSAAALHLLHSDANKGKLPPAERVATAFRACVDHPPRMTGTTTLGHADLFVRRLAPQEDKLDLKQIKGADLEPLAAYLGALLGAAHARGATQAPKKAWTKDEQAHVLERAVTMAGVHEAAYLVLCKLARAGA
jgi:uncharacterized protein (DUF2252 family)